MREEDIIQKSICDWIATVAPTVIVYAVPNSARRTASGRASNAVPGLRKGVWDLALILPRFCYRVAPTPAFVECKTRRGKLTPKQEQFRLDMIRMGVPHVIARSIDDVRTAFDAWMVPTRESRAPLIFLFDQPEGPRT